MGSALGCFETHEQKFAARQKRKSERRDTVKDRSVPAIPDAPENCNTVEKAESSDVERSMDARPLYRRARSFKQEVRAEGIFSAPRTTPVTIADKTPYGE